jgi:hypothetical protein
MIVEPIVVKDMSAPPSPSATTIRGYGGYGVVVSPALENTDETGAVLQFPGMVSKIMVEEGVYEKALENASDIQKRVPDLYVETIPYKKSYHYRNLPKKVQEELKIIKPTLNDSSSVYVVRMPDLGESIHKLIQEPVMYRQYRQIPVRTMVLEMLKCMRIVQNIGAKGMIHGDIRDTNVLVNVHTGTMTIVDFDWFMGQDDFLNVYPQPYYSLPFEILFCLRKISEHYLTNADMQGNPLTVGRNNILQEFLQTTPLIFKATVSATIDHMFQPGTKIPDDERYSFIFDKEFYHKDYTQQCLDGAMELYDLIHSHKAHANEVMSAFCSASVDTYDSFGLAVTLRMLFDKVLIHPEHEGLYNYCFRTLFPKMMHGNVIRRWNIERAIDEFMNFVRTSIPDVHLGEAPSIQDEIKRLSALTNLLHGRPDFRPTNQSLPQQLAQVTNTLTNQKGGKRNQRNQRKKRTKTNRRKKQTHHTQHRRR